jgi:hypothetical protein
MCVFSQHPEDASTTPQLFPPIDTPFFFVDDYGAQRLREAKSAASESAIALEEIEDMLRLRSELGKGCVALDNNGSGSDDDDEVATAGTDAGSITEGGSWIDEQQSISAPARASDVFAYFSVCSLALRANKG